jgi:hypothetical protein
VLALVALIVGLASVPLLLPLGWLASRPGTDRPGPAPWVTGPVTRPDRSTTLPSVEPGTPQVFGASGGMPGEREMRHRGVPSAATPPPDAGTAPWGRRIVRQAMLEIELGDVDRGIRHLAEAIEAAGGFVAGTEVQSDESGPVRARITAHVPPDRFGAAIGGLDALGRVTLRRITGQDVSEEFVDLEARRRNLERHEAQLLSFMGRAQKVSDLLSLETELARVRGEIERLGGRLRFLGARTEMATVQVALVRAPAVTPVDEGLARAWERIAAAFRAGWVATLRALVAVAVALAQVSPLTVFALVAWLAYRRWARVRPAAVPPAVV